MKAALSLLALTLGAVSWPAGATDLGSKVVTFTNGWQPGVSGTGEVRITGSGAPGPNWTFRFTFATDAVEDKLGIRCEITDFTPDPANAEEELFARMTGAVTEPDFLVTQSGQFAGLKDLPGLRRTLRDDIRESFARPQAARADPANFERFIDTATTQEVLEGRVAEDWHRMVSRWIDARARVGKEYKLDDVVALPIPRRPLPKLSMHGTYTVTRLERCDRAGLARTCAVLALHLTPDDADLARVTHEVFGNTPTKGKDGDIPAMAVTVDAELVTEVDGLIPHRYAITKKVEVNLSADGKNSQRTLDQRETTFTYP
jgi:hypothetical protein